MATDLGSLLHYYTLSSHAADHRSDIARHRTPRGGGDMGEIGQGAPSAPDAVGWVA